MREKTKVKHSLQLGMDVFGIFVNLKNDLPNILVALHKAMGIGDVCQVKNLVNYWMKTFRSKI